MKQGRSAARLWAFLALASLLSACQSVEEDPNRATADEAELDVAITGSVGDGPIVEATLTVFAKTGEMLSSVISDETAGYNIELRTKGKYYPLVIDARGGVDLATQLPPGFTLRSASTEPRKKAVVNVNPFTTVALAAAEQMNGGLSSSDISAGLAAVLAEFNSGLTSALSLDPMTTPIDDGNLAEIVKASEVFAEILRRTRDAVARTASGMTIDGVIEALGADLVDGSLDGAGAANTNRRVSAMLKLVAAQVSLEAMTNELRVNGLPVTAVLDDIVLRLASGRNVALTDSRPVNAPMIDRALSGIDAAIALADSAELQGLRTALAGLGAGATPEAARLALPAGSGTLLEVPIAGLADGTDADVTAVLTGVSSAAPDPNATTDPTLDPTSDPTTAPDPTTDPAPTNSPPTISGTPAEQVLAGSSYAFRPTAADADGDALTFAAEGRPAWASFDAGTGLLSGNPTGADVGTYSNIVISVSDGIDQASLGAFSITVTPAATGTATLSWTPPTENTDGSPLSNLAGYRVYWGSSPGSYTESVYVANPGVTSYVVENLLSGSTYYFAITAVNEPGAESTFSNEASKAIP